jgi:small subunit ribosomal protein S1
MSDSFAQLFEESLKETPMVPGAVIVGTIIRIASDYVVVSAGLNPNQLFQSNNLWMSVAN